MARPQALLRQQSVPRGEHVRVSALIGTGPLVAVPPQGTKTLYEVATRGKKREKRDGETGQAGRLGGELEHAC